MKTALVTLFVALASPLLHAKGVYPLTDHESVASSHEASESLPSNFGFESDSITILDPSWYVSIFEGNDCESPLKLKENPTSLGVHRRADHKIEVSLNGQSMKAFSEAKASYVPVYMRNGRVRHPHVLIALKDWVTLYMTVHRQENRKHLVISVVVHDGLTSHRHPVLEAYGE